MAKFTDVIYDVTKEGRKLPTNEYKENGLHPIIDQGQNDIAGYTDETEGLFSDVPAIIFGDHTRVIKYVDTPFFIGADGVKILKAKEEKANYKFLYYALASAKIPNTGYNRHFKWLKEIDIPLYSEQEQIKIVSELDKITSLIDLQKQQLTKLDELVKSRFIEMFGDPVVNPKSWETAPLSALIINANNGMARRGKDEDGNIVLRLVELQNGFIDYSAPNRICLNETEKKRYELVDNDFLFARVNGNPDYVGRCAVFKSIEEPVFHNDHIIRVHFDETKINGCFTSVLLNSDYGKRQMREQIKTSAGQYTISQDGIGAIMAILPPLELQNQFTAFVEQTDKLKLEVKKSLEKLETLKKSLMQQYFG